MKELVKIQNELKAPKDKKNSFGNYNYRSCESILESVKPLLLETNCFLTLTDDVVEVGGRIYVKAIATITNKDGLQVSTTALARESETKKGMDDSQITGTASSYARKYALNGLFAIDDAKDADTDEFHKESTAKSNSNSTADLYRKTKEQAIAEVEKSATVEELTNVWNKYVGLKTDADFKGAVARKNKELSNNF